MATATTPEHAALQAQSNAGQVEARTPRRAWISIDSGFATVVAVSALAVAAFTYLNSRMDTLSGRLDNVATELRAEIKQVTTELRAEIKQVGAEAKRYAERTDDKIDKLNDKIEKLNDKFDRQSAETNDKFDRLTDKLNELIIAQSRAN